MEKKYKCNILGCPEPAEHQLCDEHKRQYETPGHKMIMCSNCGHYIMITKIVDKKILLKHIKECQYCKGFPD